MRVAGKFSTIARYTLDERDALLELARSFDQMPRREARGVPRPSITGTRPGDDYNRRMTWPALLESHGWTHVYDRGETSYWRRPGKAHGVSATTNHAGADVFYPFSSSTEFEPDTSYSKFGVYAVLEHGGDYARAAKQLAAEGYGETVTTSEPASVACRGPDATEHTHRAPDTGQRDRDPAGALVMGGPVVARDVLAAGRPRGRRQDDPGVHNSRPT